MHLSLSGDTHHMYHAMQVTVSQIPGIGGPGYQLNGILIAVMPDDSPCWGRENSELIRPGSPRSGTAISGQNQALPMGRPGEEIIPSGKQIASVSNDFSTRNLHDI